MVKQNLKDDQQCCYACLKTTINVYLAERVSATCKKIRSKAFLRNIKRMNCRAGAMKYCSRLSVLCQELCNDLLWGWEAFHLQQVENGFWFIVASVIVKDSLLCLCAIHHCFILVIVSTGVIQWAKENLTFFFLEMVKKSEHSWQPSNALRK